MLFRSYSLTPGTILEDTAQFNTLSIYDIYQNNTSNNAIQLKWQLISTSIPAGWDYSLCEYGTCYPGIPNGGTMDSVVVGSMGFLGLNINPFFIPGTAVVKVFVYENGFFSLGDTLTWIIHALPTSINEFSSDFKLNCFPVPANEFLSVELSTAKKLNRFSYSIYSTQGNLMQSEINIESTFINIQSLSEGRYFLLLFADGRRFRPISFIKIN